jgi:hypothetical protein
VLILASASRNPSPVPATSLAAENTSRGASNRKRRSNGEAIRQGKTPCAAPPATIQENQRRRPALPEGRRRRSASGHHGIAAPRHGQKDRKTSRPNTARVSCLLLFALPLRRDGDGTEVGRTNGGVETCSQRKPGQPPRFFSVPSPFDAYRRSFHGPCNACMKGSPPRLHRS